MEGEGMMTGESEASAAVREPIRPGGVSIKTLLMGALALIVVSNTVLFVWLLEREGRKPPSLPVLAQIGEFSLVDQQGRTVTRGDLAGNPWIAAFIFTRCGGPCPAMSRQMQELQRTLPPEVGLVSLTVDPEYDTPERLGEYAERYQADARRWRFLTGEKAVIYGLARELLVTAVEEENEFIHSTSFLLVDSPGRLRAASTVLDDDFGVDQTALDTLTHQAAGLVRKTGF
jgi:cytochrome oxidase Cu insertion factor (SCO1/SenC/PrrC family)